MVIPRILVLQKEEEEEEKTILECKVRSGLHREYCL